jgi:sugar phosphate permease
VKGYRWVVLAFLMAAFTMSYMDRFSWTVVMPEAVPALGWTMAQGGAMVSGFYAGYIITQVPGGAMADRFSPRLILSASVALMGILTFLTPFGRTFGGMLALRVMAGLGAGPIFASGVKYLLAWFPRNERATAMGLFTLGSSVGTLLVNATLPALTVGHWQNAYAIPGLITVFVAVAILAAAPARPGTTGEPTSRSRSKVAEPQAQPKPLDVGSYSLACLASFLRMGPAMGFVTWTITFFIKGQGFSALSAGGMMSAYSGAAIVGNLAAGPLSDRVGKGDRKSLSIVALVLSGIAIMSLGLNQERGLFAFIILAAGLTHGMVSVPLNTFVGELTAGTGREGRLMGLYNMTGQIGAMIFPVLLGWILDTTGSYAVLYLTIAASRLLAAVAVWPLRETKAHA